MFFFFFVNSGEHLDILAISCDSFNPDVNEKIGRQQTGKKNHLDSLQRMRNYCSQYKVHCTLLLYQYKGTLLLCFITIRILLKMTKNLGLLIGMSLTRCRSSAARDFCVHHVYVELHAKATYSGMWCIGAQCISK